MALYYSRTFVISRLELWLEAEAAIATGQSYKIGSRELRRANLPEITEQIAFWEAKLAEIEAQEQGRKGGLRKTFRVVPRDL